MFISVNHLMQKYGLDKTVARFFVDREPPKDNLYWKDKLLYLRPAVGYLFIPLIVDLLYKLGLEKKQLLSEEFVGTMEAIGHISALEETRQISTDEATARCADVVKNTCKSPEWYLNVLDFLNAKKDNFFSSLSTPFKALHRGDVFLFAICALDHPRQLNEKIAECWFALISTLLLLDDSDDLEDDLEAGEENAFIESGLNSTGINNLQNLCTKNIAILSRLNSVMAKELDDQANAAITKASGFKR